MNTPFAYKVLFYIIKSFKGYYRRFPKRTELIKLIYLTDLDYYRNYGEIFTEFEYIYYKKGPWTKQFHLLIEYMKNEEIMENRRIAENGNEFFLYNITKKTPRHNTQLEDNVVDIVLKNLFIYQDADLKLLLDAVYKQEPMLSTKRNEPIDFTRVALKGSQERENYRRKRNKYLKEIARLENRMEKDDLRLLEEFRPLRARANELI